MEIISFSANSVVWHVQFYLFKSRLFVIILRIHASGWFVRMENKNILPILTFKFKNVLRTFEDEIFKLLKNIQLQPKN